MYELHGEPIWPEMLDADEATEILVELRARLVTETAALLPALAATIGEVEAHLAFLADDAAAEAITQAGIDHRADLFADMLAGL